MSATIIPFPSERAALAREFGALFPESTREDREAFANLVMMGVDKRDIIEGRRYRLELEQQREQERRPLPARGEMVRRVLQRTKARRDARRPGGAG
ncbi:hypothetical protein [Arenimonas sp.]|uniref:hypothetical protein n=1 Tax=Arenimonas sp. TaxID=1872635 RepID=UPI0035B2FF17